MTQELAQPSRTMREDSSDLWSAYERFAHSNDPFDRTTALMLFNAATYMDSIKKAATQR